MVSVTSEKKQSRRQGTTIPRATLSHVDSQEVAPAGRRKTRCLHGDVVPREEQGPRDGREETVTGTRTGVGTGGRPRAGLSTRTGMGARTEAKTGARIEMRVEGRGTPELTE